VGCSDRREGRVSLHRCRIVPAAIAGALAALIAGCGGTPVHTSTRSPTGTGSDTAPPRTARAATPAIATATVIQSTDLDISPFSISVYDLRRDGPFLVLDLSTSCEPPNAITTTDADSPSATSTTSSTATGAPSPQVVCTPGLAPDFNQGPVQNGNDDEDTAAGVYLVDPVNNQAYYAVRDGDRHPFTTEPSSNVSYGVRYYEWVRFPAPPADVTKLDVTFQDGGPVFSAIPITTSSHGPTPAKGGVIDPPGPFNQSPQSSNTSGLFMPVSPLTLTSGTTEDYVHRSGQQQTVTLSSDVLFRFGKANLSAKAKALLASVAGQIKGRAQRTVAVTGYTDSIGSDAVNLPLSRNRASAVVAALKPLTPGVHYRATGLGSADPVAPNTLPGGADNPAGRRLNRRVTITFTAASSSSTPPAPSLTPSPASIKPTASGLTFTANPDQSEGNELYRFSVDSLTRDGDLLLLHLDVTCLKASSPSSGVNSCDSIGDLSGGSTVPPTNLGAFDSYDAYHLNGFYIEDPSDGLISNAPRDEWGNGITGTLDNAIVGQTYSEWAYFPDPSPSASSVVLFAPNDSGRIDVPIS
jgi:outer membrane protein OmpA-like peptidoglycan-associated protein